MTTVTRTFTVDAAPETVVEYLKDFSHAEQQALINEGLDVQASNLDRLDIAGTHYEALDAALAAEDEEGWLA